MNNEELKKGEVLSQKICVTKKHLVEVEEFLKERELNFNIYPQFDSSNIILIPNKYVHMALILEKEETESKLEKLKKEFAAL